MKRLIVAVCCLLLSSPACNKKDAVYYHKRGDEWSKKGKRDKAIQYYTKAIRLDPESAGAYHNRGFEWNKKGEYGKAISDYNKAIQLKPTESHHCGNLAWILATCSDSRYRDGRKSVENARKACELTDWLDDYFFGTLAAAYAENGEFDEAVKWQKNAVELAPDKYKEELRYRLEFYESGKPYRD